MSKRTYLSGSQKRKKVLAQKEITEKLPKLTSFFTVEETNKSGSCSSSSPQDKNTSENNQEKEVITCNENDKHTSIAELSTSSNCELIIANLENVSVSHDPGQYCDDILTEEVRNIWIRKGPEFFQNKHCDFSETSTSFPDSSGKTKTRYLTKNVFTRKLKNGESLDRKWLLYSPTKKSVYCYCCRLIPLLVII